MKKEWPDYGWIFLTGYVIGYDVWALKNHQPTLTADLRSSLRHPAKRWPVILAWMLLTFHLFGPEKYDPFWPLEEAVLLMGKKLGW